MKSKFYKDLTVDEKINFKSWGFWRMPSKNGFIPCMIDNAVSFKRDDYAEFTKHLLVSERLYSMPK